MFSSLQRWMGLRSPAGIHGAVECFGEARVSRKEGMEILQASAARRGQLQGIRDRLSSMTRSEKDELVDRVWARVALYVFDLPASRAHHHSRRFGLLDHLLEVADFSSRELSAPGFQISPDASVNHRERPMWIYAGVVAALAHDIGKTLDLDVLVPGTSSVWNPRTEPLRHFCKRQGLEETGPALWNFHPGRGVHGHERHAPEILPLVLPPTIAEYLGPRLETVLQALLSGKDYRTSPDLSWAACEVARVVHWADQMTARGDPGAQGVQGGGLPSGAEGGAKRPSGVDAEGPAPAVEDSLRSGEPIEAPGVPPAGSSPSTRLDVSPTFHLPTDFWQESVGSPRKRRGDPEENRRRLAAELDPTRFISTVWHMIVMRRLSRNGLYTEIYVGPEAVWMIVPRSLRRIAKIIHLPFDTEVLELMLKSLGSSPQVDRRSPEQLLFYIKTGPGRPTDRAVRIRTTGFLTEVDLAQLKLYDGEIHLVDPQGSESGPGEETREPV